MKYSLYILVLFFSVSIYAQSFISGKVIDGEFNEPLPFANVILKSNDNITKLGGTTTDFDGNFSFEIAPGQYLIEVSFIGYGTKIINQINLGTNDENSISVVLLPASDSLEEVVVTTTARRNTEASVLTIQKRSVNLIDGLSSQSIRKSGDSDLAAAIKRVPGVSVQGGKFVYVRGLGDRYSKTTLGGLDIPGLDPDKNTLQLDIFPTTLLDNIIVNKSSSANLSADFSGGVINIVLKDFSIKPEYGISISSGYNSLMSFKDAPSLPKESLDFLNFDNGYNDLPFDPKIEIYRPERDHTPLVANQVTNVVDSFSKQLGVSRYNNMTDYSIGATASNQYDLGQNSIGYIATLNYRYDSTYYEDAFNGTVLKETSGLAQNTIQQGEVGQVQALASALFGLVFKTNKSKHKITFLNIKSGESSALDVEFSEFLENLYNGEGQLLNYTDRVITTIPISGTYNLANNNFQVEWKVAPSFARVYDKDFRRTFFELENGRYTLDASSTQWPTRLWRNLEEDALASKVDIYYNYKINGYDNKLRFGAAYSNKERDFTTSNYQIGFLGLSSSLNGDPNQILLPANLWRLQTPNRGAYTIGSYQRTNQYMSKSNITAAYVSNELKISAKLKSILGVRFEKYNTVYTGETIDTNVSYNDDVIIDVNDIYPSVNLINSFNENTNLRFSYARTTARPSFRESSGAQIFDPITERTFLGNPSLVPTYVNNFDLRYEKFGNANQVFAISTFYKSFKDPIEIIIPNFNSPNTISAANNDDAFVYGLELEYRKNLIENSVHKLSLNLNISLIESVQKMNEEEFRGRTSTEPDRDIKDTRKMQGQSPFIVNTGVSFVNYDKNFEIGTYFNVQGKTLEIVGAGNIPDVYTQPFNNLKLNATKTFGQNNNHSISLKVDNLLGDLRESLFDYYGNTSFVFSSLNPGRTISLGYSIKF
ncbi:MAG: TonB-dependent receptor domain-containing protein [Flavobacteriaceae bacterium]